MHGIDFLLVKGIDGVADFQVTFDVRAALRNGEVPPLFGGWIKHGVVRPNVSIAVAKECAIVIAARCIG